MNKNDPARAIGRKAPALALALALALAAAMACAQPAEKPDPPGPDSRHEYRPDLKPDVVPVPEAVTAALPGLLNDNIYLYLEIAPTLNLVAYTPDYTRAKAVEMCARAFAALAEDPNPKLRKGVEFWIIQVQPEPGSGDAPASGDEAGGATAGPVLVWGVRPEEADAYLRGRNLAEFLAGSEYLLVDDVIIPAGAERLAPFPGLELPGLPGTESHPPEPGPPPDGGEPAPLAPDGPPPVPAEGEQGPRTDGGPDGPVDPSLSAPEEDSAAQP